MTTDPEMPSVQIPGYAGGPFSYQPGLLGEHLFWVGHLHNCYRSEDVEALAS